MRPLATRTAALVGDSPQWLPGNFGVALDTREQVPWIFPPDVAVKVGMLPAGDVSIPEHETEIALERKGLEDAVHCFVVEYEGRFGRELDKLSHYDFAAIIVEASLEDVEKHRYRSRVTPGAVLSRAATITAVRRIPVLFCGDAKRAADFGLRLLRRWWEHRIARGERAP